MRMIVLSIATSLATSAIAPTIAVWLVREELALRPPIAIVDYGPIGTAVSLGESPDKIKPYFAEIKRRTQAYKAAGYIVINAASVDAAPAEIFLPPLDDIPDAWRGTPVAPASAGIPGLGAKREGGPE
jgi:hypothetical protein